MEKAKAKFLKFKRWIVATFTIIIVLLAGFFAIPILFPPTPPTGAAGSTVATSTLYSATTFPYQVKDFHANDLFWTFYSDDYYLVYAYSYTGKSWTFTTRSNITNSPSATSGGWTSGTYAYANDTNFASVTSATPSVSQNYSGYGFSLPVTATILSVRIRYDAKTAGNEQIRVNASWDSGSTWSAQQTTSLTTSEVTYYYDITAVTSWTAAKLSDTNLRVGVDAYTVGTPSTVSLDWLPVEVIYYDIGSQALGVCTFGYSASVKFDGTYVHYTRFDIVGYDLFWYRGIPNSNGTISWEAGGEQLVYNGTSAFYYRYPCVTVDSGGKAWIGVNTLDGANCYPFVLKNSATTSWSEEFSYKLSTTSSNFWRVQPVALTSLKVYVIYQYTNDYLRGKLYNSGWGSEESDLGDYGGTGGGFNAVGDGDNIHFTYNRATTYQIRYNKRTYGTGWAANCTLVQDTMESTSAPALSIDVTSGDLYCFWSKIDVDHVYYKKCVAGTWDTNPTDWIDESTDDIQSGIVGNAFSQSYGEYIGFLYVTKLEAPYNVKFASLAMQRNRYELWVNMFNSTQTAWTEIGDLPYLNNDTENYITSPLTGYVESWFSFEQTNRNVQQAYLFIECAYTNITVTLNNGESNYTYDFSSLYGLEWKSVNVSNAINTQTRANNALMSIKANEDGGVISKIYRCYIRIFNGGVYGDVLASDQRAEHTCMFSVLWTDPDGMSSYAFNHNASSSWLGSNVTGSLSGTQVWSNETITLQPDSTGFISVIFYSNDTNNNWESTGINTFPVISKYFSEDYLNILGQTGTFSTQHSLGRNNFYIDSLKLYIQLYTNATHEVYSVSTNGKTWDFGGAIRERDTDGAGFWYSYHEYRDGINYLHYMYSNELTDNIYYRRGVINSNKTVTFPVAEQMVVNHTGFFQLAVNGLCTDLSGHVFMAYYWRLTYEDNRAINVTCSSATDGTWATQSGYPQTVNSIDTTSHEAYVVPLLDEWDVYVVWTETDQKTQGRMIDNNVLQSTENVTDNAIREMRFFSIVSDTNGNVHFVQEVANGTYFTEYSFWNYTTKSWTIKSEFVTQNTIRSYPIISYDYYSDKVFVNWFTEDECWVINKATEWQNKTRIFMTPDGYITALDPNVLIPQCSQTALIGFQTQNIANSLYYEWVYLYIPLNIQDLSVGWNNFTAWTMDVDRTLGEINASLNLDSIDWAVITVDYGNGTQWSLVYGQTVNSEKLVASIADTIWIYCNVAGTWEHEYP